MRQLLSLALATLIISQLTLSTFAQDTQPPLNQRPERKAAPERPTAEMDIYIGDQQVRFISRKPTQELRLQIFNKNDELIFDSGVVFAGTLEWSVKDNNDKALEPGLYVYRLSSKEQQDQPEKMHGGQFIIEKSRDQMWVTTRDDSNFGKDVTGGPLTVTRNADGTLAGATTNQTSVKKPIEKPKLEPGVSGLLNVGGTGTAGRLTKWDTNGTDIVNSFVRDLDPFTEGVGIRVTGNVFSEYNTVTGTGDGPSGPDIYSAFLSTGNRALLLRTASQVGGIWIDNAVPGHIGIGTFAPNQKLDVRADVANVPSPGPNTPAELHTAIYGKNAAAGIGVWGQSSNTTGVFGLTGTFPNGFSNTKTAAVYGLNTTGGAAVYGETTNTTPSSTAAAIYGMAASNHANSWAGYFSGKGYFSGFVGIGTASPQDPLHVAGDIRVGTGTTGCVKDADGTVIIGVCSSDLRFKHTIKPFSSMLNKVASLRPVNFYWRASEFPDKHFGTKESFGLIAQDVEEVLPELVTTDEQGYKAVNYSKLPLLTIQAIKELKAENEALNQTNQLLQKQNASHLQLLQSFQRRLGKVERKLVRKTHQPVR